MLATSFIVDYVAIHLFIANSYAREHERAEQIEIELKNKIDDLKQELCIKETEIASLSCELAKLRFVGLNIIHTIAIIQAYFLNCPQIIK